MVKKDLMEIKWDGLVELQEHLKDMNKNVEKITIEEMTEFGMLAEEGTKALVHHDEGDLEDSINFDQAKKEGDSIAVHGGSNMEYALRRHEEPGRGPGTLAKPSWRGYQPGRKYLENAMKSIEADYDKMNVRTLERILETDE